MELEPDDPRNIEAVNKAQRIVLTRGGDVLPFIGLYAADGDEVEDIDEAAFTTVQHGDGSWSEVIFSDFNEQASVN